MFYLIGGFILFLIIINFGIFFYFKYQRKAFFTHIKSRNYSLIEDVEIYIESYSKLSTKLSNRKSDVIFLDEEIFVLTFSKPILRIGNGSEVFPAIGQRFSPSSRTIHNNMLEITGNTCVGNFKIQFNFKNKNFDLHSIL